MSYDSIHMRCTERQIRGEEQGSSCRAGEGQFFLGMHASGVWVWWWLHNLANMLENTELHILEG
jgi:hypothetical protein